MALTGKHSPIIEEFIQEKIVNYISVKIQEKEAKKTAKNYLLRRIMEKFQEDEVTKELSLVEYMKAYELIDKSDVQEDQTIIGNTIGKYLESAPTIQTNVNSNVPTLVNGTINNLTIPNASIEELTKEEMTSLKDLFLEARKQTIELERPEVVINAEAIAVETTKEESISEQEDGQEL